jgi:RNA polymerase sigma-70 factor (ECF subfamily)
VSQSLRVGAEEPGDGVVVRRVLDGDVEAFRILVERYRVAFGRYAVAFVGEPDAAADAMQEAFIRAYDALATCRDPQRFGAWFFRILQNQCRTARRRMGDREDLDRVEVVSRERADRATEQAELAALLDEALASLTAEQREAFVMKHVEGRSYEEMAGLLGVGTEALKMRVHRARDALKERLGGRL